MPIKRIHLDLALPIPPEILHLTYPIFQVQLILCRLCKSLFVFPEDLKGSPDVSHTTTKDGVEVTSVNTANKISQELVKHYVQLYDKEKEEADGTSLEE